MGGEEGPKATFVALGSRVRRLKSNFGGKAMKSKAILGARLLLGFIFAVFGVNGLMMIFTGNGFIPMPPQPPAMMEVMGGFFKAGYLMPLVKVLEVVAGVLLLAGIYKRLALTLLAPIVVNIFGLHLFLAPDGLAIAVLVLALEAFLIATEWEDGFDKLLER
jgi:uncharacterized membrane protein YphA (DoxX/SURF4 family)